MDAARSTRIAAPIGEGTNEHPIPPKAFLGLFHRVRAVCFGYMSFLISMVTFAIAVPSLLLDPKQGRLSYKVVQNWSAALIGMSGSHVRIEGRDKFRPDEARLLVVNHCSWFDPPAVWQTFPGQVRFVLKKELLKVPFIGLYSKWAGHFLLDRGNPREGVKVIERALERARRDNLSPVVFPEGTRSKDGRLGALRAGAFELALKGGLNVQPVAVLGTYAIWPGGLTAPRCAGEILVRVGDPIDTTGLKGGVGRRALAAQTRDALIALGVPAWPADDGDDG